MTMLPEKTFQKSWGIVINSVLAFMRSVKNITESAREMVTVSARRNERVSPRTLPPTMTGRRGSTHGVSTVSTPAVNDMRKSIIILFYFCNKRTERWASAPLFHQATLCVHFDKRVLVRHTISCLQVSRRIIVDIKDREVLWNCA